MTFIFGRVEKELKCGLYVVIGWFIFISWILVTASERKESPSQIQNASYFCQPPCEMITLSTSDIIPLKFGIYKR